MAWPDWNNLAIENTHLAWLVAAPLIVGAASLLIPSRHGGRAIVAAALIRAVVVIAVAIAILGLVSNVENRAPFNPEGTWVLALSELDGGEFYPDAFIEDGDTFVARVRDALAAGNPPRQTEVVGPRDEGADVRDRLLALGMPCRLRLPMGKADARPPVLTGIDAPAAVKPNEAVIITPEVAGEGGEVRLFLNGEVVEPTGGRYVVRSDVPGAHVIEAVLHDGRGNEVQRRGHVFRVGERPNVLALGLTDEQLNRAVNLVPDYKFRRAVPGDLHGSLLEDVAVVLTSIETLYRMGSDASELAMFVARGGGLYVTGDGAKFVAPEYMPDDVRRLLPVLLKKEGTRPPDEDPPVSEEEVKAELAKVSLYFVLDRSTSMDALVGQRGRPGTATRWQIATKGVVESIKLVEQGGRRGVNGTSEALGTRIGVMSFTLSQNWVYEPRPVLPFNSKQIEKDLKRLKGDQEYDKDGYNTDIYAAMEAAVDRMIDEPSAVKVVVMLTDGADRDVNTMGGNKHAALREKAIRHDINIITVGIGEEFAAGGTGSTAARKVIRDLATRPEFANIPADAEAAAEAYVIFVDAVETAFETYADKKKQEEGERKQRLEELENEAENVEVMPGTFPLILGNVGRQMFGDDALPENAPKLAWLARNEARDGTAVALAAETGIDGITPVLAFRGYGLGRVAFWGAGTDPENLGELTGWGDFPGIFAASLRWLQPREQPDVRLVGEGSPEGLRILDPIDGARYLLIHDGREISLQLEENRLVPAEGQLPRGAGEVIEEIGGERRRIGDVYIGDPPPVSDMAVPAMRDTAVTALPSVPGEITRRREPATSVILLLLTGVLILMPIERIIRRRH